MGTATALALEARGAEVCILERAVVGAEASSAAAGILGAQVEAHDEAELRRFSAARDGYASFVAELEARTGVSVGYRKCGAVKLLQDAEVAREMCKLHESVGLRAELLDGARVREVEPSIADDRTIGLHFPDDAQVEPQRLLRALAAACSFGKVDVRSGAVVSGLVQSGGKCTGVLLGDERLEADAVVLAAGSWASLVPGVPASLPKVVPARGQIVELEERPVKTKKIVFHGTGYVVPRGDGRVLCGSTLEHVGYEKDVTAKGVVSILSAAMSAVPSLAAASVSRYWSNFRPQVPEGGPLVGRSSLDGLFLATGHYRNGILLAHETSKEVAEAIFTAR